VEFINWILRNTLGWHRYRMKFIYRDKFGNDVFSHVRTLGFVRKKMVSDERKVKQYIGPIYIMSCVYQAEKTFMPNLAEKD
jgi:hypothetical protein